MIRSHEVPEDAGEGYFASISDLMVGILFIFLLMLAVFAINYANDDKDKEIARLTALLAEKDARLTKLAKLLDEIEKEVAELKSQLTAVVGERDKLRKGVADLVKQLEGVSVGLRGEQNRLEGVRSNLLLSLQEDLSKRGVTVEVDPGQGILRLSSEGLFVLDRDEFTPKGQENAVALLQEMARLLPCYSSTPTGSVDCPVRQPIFETVLIEGHTDTRPTDRRGGNWTLSTDRARAFLELMTGAVTSLRDLRNNDGQPLLGLAGYGDSRPRPNIAGTDDRNRRIEVRFLLSGQRENFADRIRRLDDLLTDLRKLAEP